MTDVTRNSLIEAARQAAKEHGGPISRTDIFRLAEVSMHYIYPLFPDGGWSELRECAGIERHPRDNVPLHKAQLLSYMKLLDIPLGLILNFHEERLTDGVSRLILPRANP